MFLKKQRQGHSQRHKCSSCGKVRYEKFMEPLTSVYGGRRKTRYGHDVWFCADKQSCLTEKREGFVY